MEASKEVGKRILFIYPVDNKIKLFYYVSFSSGVYAVYAVPI